MVEPIITIFTPAYNRAHTLRRTYESLKRQTVKSFIWMIIDDGSTDNTKEIVAKWISEESEFRILYFYKENGGMHTAHNLAYEKMETELNVCIDSDDWMPKDAVESICDFWKENGSDKVAGIVALDADSDGKVIGTLLPKEVKTATTHSLYSKYRARGDKKFIYRTEIIKSVPAYPVFSGEKLVPLGYKYELVSDTYEMLLMNKIVCIVNYQPDGSSNTIFKQYIQSPKGFAAGKIIRMQRADSIGERCKCVVHYVAECRIAKDREWLTNSPYKLLTIGLYPFGCVLELYIKCYNRTHAK